jgi:hypothetical protein
MGWAIFIGVTFAAIVFCYACFFVGGTADRRRH